MKRREINMWVGGFVTLVGLVGVAAAIDMSTEFGHRLAPSILNAAFILVIALSVSYFRAAINRLGLAVRFVIYGLLMAAVMLPFLTGTRADPSVALACLIVLSGLQIALTKYPVTEPEAEEPRLSADNSPKPPMPPT